MFKSLVVICPSKHYANAFIGMLMKTGLIESGEYDLVRTIEHMRGRSFEGKLVVAFIDHFVSDNLYQDWSKIKLRLEGKRIRYLEINNSSTSQSITKQYKAIYENHSSNS